MNLAEHRDRLHVSVSQLRCYMRCPRQYKFRYVEGRPPAFTSKALAFGRAFHETAAVLFDELADNQRFPDSGALHRVLDERFARELRGRIPLEPGTDWGAQTALANKMLDVLFDHLTASVMPVVVAAELPWSVALLDPVSGMELEEVLVGAFDLVLKEGNGNTIVEIKTAARKWSESEIRHDIQLGTYRVAGEDLGWEQPHVRLLAVTKTKVPVVQVVEAPPSPTARQDIREIALGVLRSVNVKAYHPNPNVMNCAGCPYQGACGRALAAGDADEVS